MALLSFERVIGVCLLLCVLLVSWFGESVAVKVNTKCGPSYKLSANGTVCESLTTNEVIRAIHFLANPPVSTCHKVVTVQDLSVCEDDIDYAHCEIWSSITSQECDHYGSLEFERYFAKKGCRVTVFHFATLYKGNICSLPVGPMSDEPNVHIQRIDVWAKRCYNCLYRYIATPLSKVERKIDVFKVQARAGVAEDFDGVQYTILSDLYLHLRETVLQKINQVVFHASINSRTLTDTVGREAEMAWNMWATQQLMNSFGAFSVEPTRGMFREQPWQFTHLLDKARVSAEFAYYRTSYRRDVTAAEKTDDDRRFAEWTPQVTKRLTAMPPSYCTIPNTEAFEALQDWAHIEVNVRCHPTRLWVPCDRSRGYDAIIPCEQELLNNLAEDYAISQGWCDFHHAGAEIEPLVRVDAAAKAAFNQPTIPRRDGVRLAFFFTVYTDAVYVRRLLSHLYSPQHYYLFHVDPAGASVEFVRDMRALCSQYKNVFLSQDVPIVYGASTATMVLTRAMCWFAKYTSGWDYFVPVTGSDYPLLPLHRMEKIFQYQDPPMPFVMAWTPGTSTHIFRLQKTHPVFEYHPLLVKSIAAVTSERGAVLGAVPMEYRSSNFGPPLFCGNQSSFYHLDNRLNKTSKIYNTMWLFPRDIFPGRGRAYSEENRAFTTPSFDNEWRVWKKSDPATTGAYDRKSVEYIVNSVEGKKYWHFFKHMLLGSEEHYYVSLLYNWERTRAFVQTLSAQSVWNTWEVGLWEVSAGFQTHTHFLTLNEWEILKGFSMRGMMFARKFSSRKTAAVLDRIDEEILLNKTTDAGLYWPGFYEVDITTPGKQWVAQYRKNAVYHRKNAMPENWVAMGERVGPVRVVQASTTLPPL